MIETQKGVVLKLKVTPNASCFKLEPGSLEKELRVRVCSAARNGKANREMLRELKRIFGSSVEIIKGEKSNKKIVLVHSSKEKVLAALHQ